MAESHEPSYYEIALTNRQVVVAFVVLLTCLLGAFFSGVWIGRESTARNAQEQMVRNTPPSEASQEGKNLEELEFFDKNNKKAADDKSRGEEAAVAPAPGGSTLLEDLGGKKPEARNPPRPAAEPAEEEPAPRQAARPDPEPATDPSTIDPAQERRNRRKAARAAAAAAAALNPPETPAPVKTTPVKAAAAKATTTKTTETKATKTAAAPAIPKGSYVIQVFSSADQTQAERIRTKLTGGGQKAYLSPINRGGRTMYRVRIGPFKSHDDAQKVADQVRKGYKLDTWVTE